VGRVWVGSEGCGREGGDSVGGEGVWEEVFGRWFVWFV